MDLKEFLAKYKVDEADSAFVEGLITAERDKGTAEIKKKGKETLEKVTALNKLRDYMRDQIGIDPDGDLEALAKDFKEKLEKAGKSGGKNSDEIEALRKEFTGKLDKLTKERDDEKGRAAAAEAKMKKSKMKDILTRGFGDSLFARDLQIRYLIDEGKVKLTDDESDVVFVNGDEAVDLATGIEAFKKANPDLVKNQQAPGSGGNGGSKVIVDGKGKKSISQADFDKMSGREQHDFVVNQKGTVIQT